MTSHTATLDRYPASDLAAARHMLSELNDTEKRKLLQKRPCYPPRIEWRRRLSSAGGSSFEATYLAGVARHVLQVETRHG